MNKIKLQKDIIVEGKFWLKNGAIIEDSITFEAGKDNYDEAQDTIDSINEVARNSFMHDDPFNIWFGSTVIRGTDLSAYKLNIKGGEN